MLAAESLSDVEGPTDLWHWFVQTAMDWVPALLMIAVFVVALWVAGRFANRPAATKRQGRVLHSLLKVVVVIVGVIAVTLVLPLGDSDRAQLLSLLGILLSATIALASTTFVGNAMAGLMLRGQRYFRPGDFVKVGDIFGRVSETGLLHTEIQDSERNLTSLPNLHLVMNPITVVPAEGTIVSSTVSLGYDVARSDVEKGLLQAVEKAGLTDGFVLVMGLGDYSVSYRVSGFLKETRTLITSRSRLNGCILDALHDEGIEILSPMYIANRPASMSQAVLPKKRWGVPRPPVRDDEVDQRIFDKAEKASAEDALAERIEELTEAVDSAEDDDAKLDAEVALEVALAEREAAAAPADGDSDGDGDGDGDADGDDEI